MQCCGGGLSPRKNWCVAERALGNALSKHGQAKDTYRSCGCHARTNVISSGTAAEDHNLLSEHPRWPRLTRRQAYQGLVIYPSHQSPTSRPAQCPKSEGPQPLQKVYCRFWGTDIQWTADRLSKCYQLVQCGGRSCECVAVSHSFPYCANNEIHSLLGGIHRGHIYVLCLLDCKSLMSQKLSVRSGWP